MLFYILIGFALLGAGIAFASWYANAPPAAAMKAAKILLALFGIGLALFLVSRGGAGAIVSAAIILAPLLLGLRGAYRRARAAQGPSPGGASSVTSAWFEMSLDHDNGDISGRVRLGEHAGRQLDDLTELELDELLSVCRQDENSRRLLEAYLAKRFGHAYEDDMGDGEAASDGARGSGAMGPEEAAEILGVPKDADPAEVARAHKRLIAHAHPDRGGSAYLAAKINQARDVLLGRV